MSSSASEARDTASGRLGGARADFVGSLGRKVSDARELLNALEDDPSSKAGRDELRRRLHALGSGARLLRFEAMARSLQEVLALLDRGGQLGGLREEDVAFIAQVLDDLPALAWGEAPPRDAARATTAIEGADETPGLLPISVLVIGPESLADALTEESVVRSRAFECERTDDAQAALQLARAYAPDLVIVDADHEQSISLVEALLDDPMTEPVPVLVIGSFRIPDEASRFIALGVAKTLARPVAADMIRHACDEILDAREGRTVRMTLGEPTLEQLAERLSQELKGALTESVDPSARFLRVPLGEGTEVLGALWGAIARVQEIVSQRTKGAIRFGGDTPEGAIALAPWLHQDLPGADRMAGRGRGAAADVRLNGRRVVVADDDPGVTWFISDLLRTAGCDVHEALDGTTALELAFRVQPELVVSDILMPGLDGFALCRALRRDVGLRDTPVVLLSWKEDLLQRVRELGASAAAYMRKESDSRAVLARVREVLRPRARIEMRLRGDGEVRGRLDDLSPRLLLDLVCMIRKDARVAVRDATFLYEVEIRGGSPRRATRTASDGSFQSGERALALLLAVGAGRFSIASSNEPIRGELTGSLFEQLARPLAAARGALAAITGSRTMEVERILLDANVLEEYLRATPEPARTVLKRLAAGASPRALLLAGEAAPNLVEDLLSDLAARCAIRAVESADGTDMLTPLVDAALAVLTGAIPSRRSMPPNARPSVLPRPPAILPIAAPPAPAPVAAAPAAASPPAAAPAVATPPAAAPAAASPPAAAPAAHAASPMESLQWSTPPAAPQPPSSKPGKRASAPSTSALAPPSRVIDDDNDSDAPSSLEDAVMREISDRSPAPAGVHGGLDRPPIIDTSVLRARSSNPPATRGEVREMLDEQALLPSIPPDAIVPAASSNEEFAVAAPLVGDVTGSVEEVHQLTSERRLVVRDASPVPEPPAAKEADEAAPPPPPTAPEPARAAATPIISLPPEDLNEVPEEPSLPAASSMPPAPPKSSSPVGFVVAFALLAGAVVAVLRVTGRDFESFRPGPATTATAAAASASAPPKPSVAGPRPAPSASAPPTPTVSAATSASAAPNAPPADDDLPPGVLVPAGSGLLQIGAPAGARVLVDGVDEGTGPLSSSAQRAGYHQVRIDQDGKHSQYVIEVRPGKTTRVKSSPLP